MADAAFWEGFFKLHPRPVRVPAAAETIAALDQVEAAEKAATCVLWAAARTAPARHCAERRLLAMGVLHG